jgi:hypothetical protein
MEIDADADGWPDSWPDVMIGGSWETEGDNHFIRLTSTSPGETVALLRDIPVPTGMTSLELSWRQRISNLRQGLPTGCDARIMLEFLDANGVKINTAPSPTYRLNSPGWESKRGVIPVPQGARILRFSPSLVQVGYGTFDFDDVAVAPASPASAPAAPVVAAITPGPAPAVATSTPAPSGGTTPAPPAGEPARKEKWPPELRVQGNRLVTVAGGREVWLQGVNVPSLEWNVKGERILLSVVTAIEGWKANVIRLPVNDAYWFGRKGQTDGGESYRALVDEAVMAAANRGAYLVLDLHTFRAPRKEYLVFWTDAATRYKNHPAVLFDIMNEPHGMTWEVWKNGGFIEEKKKAGDEDAFLTPEEKLHNKRGFQSPGMQAMLDTVRATGAKNIAVVGGLDYAYDLSGIVNGFALTDPRGNGIMYASHVYPWKKNWQAKLLNAAALHPILLGEVGADAKKMTFIPANHQENASTWVPAMLGLIQKHKLNWTGWCFHPGASPRMLSDIKYTPTPFWGQPAKDALSGKQFPPPDRLR